jgi:predicted nicotinamide N-methyase
MLTTEPSLKVLELGAGCGIVGITLSTLPNTAQLLLTDLPEATEILTQNLSFLPSHISHEVLDWSAPLPAHIAETGWDLIAISDCTYNPDVVPELVKTLGELARGKEVYVLLAMKVRHESELVFFELMEKVGFEVREKLKIDLPVLGGEGESVEIFGFGK